VTARLLPVWLLCAAGAVAAAPSGKFLYRYRDAAGVLHLETALPPEAAPQGYEVLDRRTLKVLREVAPLRSPEELAADAARTEAEAQAKAQREAEAQAHAAQQAEQEQRDRALRESYTTAADLERTRDAQLTALAAIGRGTAATVERLEKNLAQMQAQRTRHQQEGRAVPPTLTANIADVEGKLSRQRALLERNARRQAELSARFAADLARYRELTSAAPEAAAAGPQAVPPAPSTAAP
jgi:hypothetical protein